MQFLPTTCTIEKSFACANLSGVDYAVGLVDTTFRGASPWPGRVSAAVDN